MSVNKTILLGRLGAEPESRAFPDGGSICNLSIATTESWKDKQTGERKERTEWHRVILRNRLGEIAQQYLHKGSQVYIEGSLRTRKWQDQNGQDRYTTEIIGREITMLDGRSDTHEQSTSSSGTYQPQSAPQQASQGVSQPNDNGDWYDDIDSDIPF